ncbi:MAG TPA: response regulator transcription factor [Gammaproteobacteria bacterium]
MYLLVVEDNRDLAANLYDYLHEQGHTVDLAYDGRAGLEFAMRDPYDVVILDLMLPRLDGLEVCRRLRELGNAVPILMLTARDTLDDKLSGFGVGADDYLVKPFDLPELEARLQALLRRQRALPRRLQVADLVLDLDTLSVQRAGQPITLAPIPLRILEVLMRNQWRVVPRAELVRVVWGDTPPESDALRAHLYQLRNAIDRPFAVPLLHTVHGLGYRIGVPDENPH